MIENDRRLEAAQKAVENLQHVLVTARKVHTEREYRLMSTPILLEIQQREQDLLRYLSDVRAAVTR